MSNKKVIVITGASSGIGKVTAKLLAESGNQVIISARREKLLKELEQEISENNGEVFLQVSDVTKLEDMEKLVENTIKEYGRIDVWINNAGIMPQSTFDKRKVEEWNQMIDVNIKGVLNGIAAVLPTFLEQNSGQIINVSSMAGYHTDVGSGVYSGTKFAVRAISDSLRKEMTAKGKNIRVSMISPGTTDTELPNKITDEELKVKIKKIHEEVSIPPERIAQLIKVTIDLPEDTVVNDLLVHSIKQ